MAKILGISPAYLSLLINGKRKWKADLKERYETLVNTFVNKEKNQLDIRSIKNKEIVINTDIWWSCGDANPVPLQCH